MTRRLFTILGRTSLLLGLATPVAADDPVDPAGQPLESSAEDEGEVGGSRWPSTTTAWWPTPGSSCRPPWPSTWA